jgi:hypothetical protein
VTGKEALTDNTALILAFDASCGTCSRIAARVAEICGHRFRISNLSDPGIAELRRGALGPDAPWTPTLFDPSTTPPRAWTGKALAVRLAAVIGPRKSWRVLKAIGAIHEEGRIGNHRDGTSRISRARFLGGIPLAVSGAGLLFATPAQGAVGRSLRITATPSHTVLARQLTGRALLDSAIGNLHAPDVQNVLDRSLASQVRAGARVDDPTYQPTLGLIRYADGGSTQVFPGSTVAGTCAVVGSAEHMVGTNKLTITAYVLPDERHLLTYESYEREFDGVRTRARLWNTPDTLDGAFSLAAFSINGSIPTRPPIDTAASRTADTDPCGGCNFEKTTDPEGSTIGNECAGGDFYNCIRSSAACASCFPSCPSPACLACVAAICSFAAAECCGGTLPGGCIPCDGGEPG